MRQDITVIISTYNEEKNIARCIESALVVTGNIIVVDTESTDKTVEIAKRYGTKVISTPFSHYVEPVRAFSIQQVKSGWIFILDADERTSNELAHELYKIIENTKEDSGFTNTQTHYAVPRKNIFAGKKWLRHGGWWPDMQIRFFLKESFINWPEKIHSTPKFHGLRGELKTPIEHHVHETIDSMVTKTAIYENIEADLLYKAGRKVSTVIFFRKFFGELFRRLILNRGFLDGTYGIIESFYQAYSKTITYLFLFEKYNSEKTKKSRTI